MPPLRYPAPAWAVRVTKETGKINMEWAFMKYIAVGVVEIDKGPNSAAINLPDFSKTAAPAPPSKAPTPPAPASKAPTPAPASKAPTPASTVSKAPPPQPASASGKASAPSGAASGPAEKGNPVASTRQAPPQALPQASLGEQEMVVRVPVLVNTRDIEVGEELFRMDVKGSNKRAFDPVNEGVLLKKAARAKAS